MDAVALSSPERLPRAYASWRLRTLVGSLVATVVGVALHGSMGEIRLVIGDDRPSAGLMVGLAALLVGAVGPGLVGTCLALAAVVTWRRPGRSVRWTRAAWIVWVVGPLPILLVPVASLFGLDAQDSLKTSATQVRHLLTAVAPAFFALLPGTLRSALVLERFLPESRAPGQITLLAAPVCVVAYLLPLAIVTQLAFQPTLYAGLLLMAASPLVPLAAYRALLRRDTPEQARHLVRAILAAQTVLSLSGIAVLLVWLSRFPDLRAWIGQINAAWLIGFGARVLASKWLTQVVVTDLLVSLLHQNRESARSLMDTPQGETLARKLDALGQTLRTDGPTRT